MPTYDPVSTATMLATAYTHAAQSRLDAQMATAQATSSALTRLRSALTAFDAALDALSDRKGMTSRSASFGDAAYGTATASSTAVPGSYPIYVEQLATAHQVMFTDLPALPVPVTGKLGITVSGVNIDVDFSTADLDGNGTLSHTEIARAINQANGNQGKVSATVVTSGTTAQLILTAGETGAASRIVLDASALTGDGGNAAEVDAFKAHLAGGGLELTAAQDAVVYIGAKSPQTMITQSSNTFTAIAGVSMTFTKVTAPDDEPITLTVAGDGDGTADNVQRFVDAYNTLRAALDEMTKVGNASGGVAGGPLAGDAGVRSLRSHLDSLLRQSFDGQSLMSYGVRADRNGVLSLDRSRLEKQIDATPGGLDQLFGNTSLTGRSGLLGGMATYVERWTDSSTGYLKARQESIQKRQAAMNRQQDRLDVQYANAYQRYLAQFTVLANLEAQMNSTSGLLQNVFASSFSSSRTGDSRLP